MYWIIVLAFLICKSSAQLTSPDEGVCVGRQVVFVCQQAGQTSRWTVVPPDGTSLTASALSSQVGTVLTFSNDRYGYEIHILPSSSASSVISELRVTAVRQLNGVTVECSGNNGSLTSTIQIALIEPPAAPSGVMTTADRGQFTPSTASITLTWTASSVADNYTIVVTPLLPSEQSLVSTTTTSLQLTVFYNKEYSINITAHNCAGSNSTIVLWTVVGCIPPSPPANGSIREYSSGAVGAMLTFQCDTGYMPQEEVTATCLSNRSWVPILLECTVINCNAPLTATGVIIEPFNDTKFGALITFHCEESNNSMTAVCGSNGEWVPNLISLKCNIDDLEIFTTDVINTILSDAKDDAPSAGSQVIITAIICSLGFLLLGMFLGTLLYHCVLRHKGKFKLTSSSPTPPAASAPVIYEDMSPANSHTERKNDIELSENVAYGPVTT